MYYSGSSKSHCRDDVAVVQAATSIKKQSVYTTTILSSIVSIHGWSAFVVLQSSRTITSTSEFFNRIQ